ncbi:kinase-like domain-containing protein [Neocallimastix lanati (nom. inval.)]|nr:kinase-like domain-containing protein [Neocallimastix sp. JGI-2020a]
MDYYNTPVPIVLQKSETDSSNSGLLELKLSPIESIPKNNNNDSNNSNNDNNKKSYYNKKNNESSLNYPSNNFNCSNSFSKNVYSASKSSYVLSNINSDTEFNKNSYNKDEINKNDINLNFSSHSSSTINNSFSGTINNSNILLSNNDNINSNNINNNIRNSNISNNQNILHSNVINNLSIENEQNYSYSTPYSHLPQSQPQSLLHSNYKVSQVPDEYYEYQYSFDKSLNDINKDEPSINQQRIDNIPRSIIQYIYSLFSKGSTVFTCNNKRYMSLQQIGRGGTSKVYKVLSQEGKILALKKIDINGSDKMAFQGYINEINLLKHLKNNSRIIQLMDSEINRDTNSIYMVMECGEIDLAKLLQKEGKKISISSIKMYWEQMLKAVHAIHEENIIHSDLKPANFLLVGSALKLIDFGIAKTIPNDTTNIHRETQTGTVNYMSPESISDFNTDVDSNQRPDFKISRASDVWSLGCILYQMVYGKPPFFRENTIFKKFKAIVNINYQIAFSSDRNQFRLESSQDQGSSNTNNINENNSTYNINDFVSSPLLEVMKHCLQREPKKRPTIPELLQQAFIHAPQISYNLVHSIVEEMLNYCNKKDDVNKISHVFYEQILNQGSF